MNEKQTKELRAHAAKLVAEGKPLSGVFQHMHGNQWYTWLETDTVPYFANGKQWRIAKPKKQLIAWSHPFMKGCATNYGELVFITEQQTAYCLPNMQAAFPVRELRLGALYRNDHANWQPFFSTPENDLKLRELAKMVKVEVRWFCRAAGKYLTEEINPFQSFNENSQDISNYRITGLQDGWTDTPEEAV